MVEVRSYKEVDLTDGAVLVSIPHGSVGGLLFTDYVLEQHRMDQVAVLDSLSFPPLAMVHAGKPRFPVRIHADPATRIAVLRCEFSPPAMLARPIAHAILDWACDQGVARIVPLDALLALAQQPQEGLPRVWFLANTDAGRRAARTQGIDELQQGTIGGIPAILLTESRFCAMDVVALLAEVREPMDEARGALAFARAVPKIVPRLAIDPKDLEADLARVEREVRQVREQTERTEEVLESAHAAPSSMMYG